MRKLYFSIILLVIGNNLFSQYYVKTKGDSIAFERDSIILNIENLPGIIDWEVSKDTLTWESLNTKNDSLWVRIDSNAYYRAVLTDGTCYPVKSAIAFVAFKSIYVAGNTVVIDSLGGVYFLPSGIKLVVPPGAVTDEVTISLDLLDADQANDKIPLDVYTGKEFCGGIYSTPGESLFQKPVKVRIPVLNLQNADIPFIYRYNTLSDTWSQYTGTLICSENEQFIEYSTDELVSARIELIKNVLSFNKSSVKVKKGEYDCHDLLMKVRTMAYDYAGQLAGNECRVNIEDLHIEFPLCNGNPVGTAHIQEISKDCMPVVISGIEKECLANGESTTLTLNVSIGGMPLDNQQVDIELPEGLSAESTYLNTDNSGNAKFTIKCNVDNFDIAEITYSVHTQYYLEIIRASAAGESEITKNYQRTYEITGTQSVGCSQIKYVELHGSNYQLKRNGTDQITCNCYDQNRQQVDCGELVYSIAPGSSYPAGGAVSVDPASGLVTALRPGVAGIQAMASGVRSIYNLSYTVAYEGILKFEGVTDHDNPYGWCGCAEDLENPLTHYHLSAYNVRYTVDINVFFWLGRDLTHTPWGDVDGMNSYTYTIAPESYCKDAVWFELVDGIDGGYQFSNNTTQEIISGAEFYTDYQYYDYRGVDFGNIIDIFLKCKFIGSDVITAHVDLYWLHGCVGNLGKVYPEDFLLK